MANTYDVGDKVKISASFADSSGAAIDPTVVVFKVKLRDGTSASYQYGVSACVAKAATGRYYLSQGASAVGYWDYRIYATGTGQSAAESYFIVQESQFD